MSSRNISFEVGLELKKVNERLLRKGIVLQVTSKVKELLAKEGFDPNLGARPLKRAIQKLILDPLALKMVTGEVKEGERVVADVQNNQKIIFRTAKDLIKTKS